MRSLLSIKYGYIIWISNLGGFIILLFHVESEGLTLGQRRTEGGKKKKILLGSAVTVSLVATPPIRSPRRPVTFQFWENGFQLERRGREPERPPRRVVVGRDQKGAWSARRPPPFILTAPLCRACCCWSGRWRRQERPICSPLLCSALCMCVCVYERAYLLCVCVVCA